MFFILFVSITVVVGKGFYGGERRKKSGKKEVIFVDRELMISTFDLFRCFRNLYKLEYTGLFIFMMLGSFIIRVNKIGY